MNKKIKTTLSDRGIGLIISIISGVLILAILGGFNFYNRSLIADELHDIEIIVIKKDFSDHSIKAIKTNENILKTLNHHISTQNREYTELLTNQKWIISDLKNRKQEN